MGATDSSAEKKGSYFYSEERKYCLTEKLPTQSSFDYCSLDFQKVSRNWGELGSKKVL